MTKSLHPWLAAALLALLWSATAWANIAAVDSQQWPNRYDALFEKYSNRYFGPHFDWRWFKAQAIAESALRSDAVSQSGARGIMQLIPATLEEILRDQRYLATLDDADANIAAGIYYGRELFRKWQEMPEQERLFMAFASYNAGYYRVRKAYKSAKVKDWKHIREHLPRETRGYITRIRALMEENQRLPSRMTLLAAYIPSGLAGPAAADSELTGSTRGE